MENWIGCSIFNDNIKSLEVTRESLTSHFGEWIAISLVSKLCAIYRQG